MDLTRAVDWSIFGMVAIVVSAGVRIIGATYRKCPKCNHLKTAHTPMNSDGVMTGAIQCSVCGKQCHL